LEEHLSGIGALVKEPGRPANSPNEGAVTMADVARLAGVSPATVSRCLNGRNVSPQIKKKVDRAITQLGYRPNLIARGLRKQVSSVWACVISDIENQFFTAVVRGVEDVARGANHSVVLCNTDEDVEREAEYLRLIEAQQMAGVIISATRTDVDISGLVRAGVQVVSVDRKLSQPVDTVLVNSHEGAEVATSHLIAMGCRRIACITGRHDTTTGEERLRGYRAALRQAGLQVDPALERYCDFKEEGALAAALELLTDPASHPDGFFVANNQMTLGVLKALASRGLAVPHDVAVAGFDDLPWWSFSHPTVTAVSQPAYDMGRAAGKMLAERIAGHQGPPRERYFEPQLVVRQSSQLGTLPGPPETAWHVDLPSPGIPSPYSI
jgi:LacI family transcriptional regulator